MFFEDMMVCKNAKPVAYNRQQYSTCSGLCYAECTGRKIEYFASERGHVLLTVELVISVASLTNIKQSQIY